MAQFPALSLDCAIVAGWLVIIVKVELPANQQLVYLTVS
jgi:hypothetical protein